MPASRQYNRSHFKGEEGNSKSRKLVIAMKHGVTPILTPNILVMGTRTAYNTEVARAMYPNVNMRPAVHMSSSIVLAHVSRAVTTGNSRGSTDASGLGSTNTQVRQDPA